VNAETVPVNKTVCPVCGEGVLESRLVTERFDYGDGEDKVSVVAENVPVQVCTNCQETFSGPEAARIRHLAICRALGLLTPDEIRAIRERLGLSQVEFAKLTDIGEATISRWERGRLLQNKAMDRYLRLLDRNPDNVRILKELRNHETGRQHAGSGGASPGSANGEGNGKGRQATPGDDSPQQEAKAMPFKVGQTYSREQISAALGGSPRAYLPLRGNRVVCGCFRVEPEWNPRAPSEVTLGAGPVVQKSAELVSRQTEPIPIFLFRDDAAWEYIGLYHCRGYSTDPALLQRKMQENPARGVITGVLYFEPVS
jgi:putative zinc finger/helix-turn-helix YgiT family protein